MTPNPKDDLKVDNETLAETYVTPILWNDFVSDLVFKEKQIRQQTAQEIQDIIIKVIRLRPDLMNDLSWRFSRLIEEEIKQKYLKGGVK